MARVFITGSTDGLGRAAADALLTAGHEIVVHARNDARVSAVEGLLHRGATVVVGELAERAAVGRIAEKLNAAAPLDAVIHNAGVWTGPPVMPVNIIAPYLLTAMLTAPRRHIYLSSGSHLSGHPRLDGVDWLGATAGSYADSKLFVTTLAMALPRFRTGVLSHAVDPGWVPTKMGGPNAPDDLELGHRTQEWLAVSDDPDALAAPAYWYHGKHARSHPAVHERAFQDLLVGVLEKETRAEL